MTTAWQRFGNVTTATGFVGNLLTGASSIVGGYKTYLSPKTAMMEVWKKLEHVQQIIRTLSEKRRKNIDIAAKQGLCKSIQEIEDEVESIRDRYCLLGKYYKTFSHRQRLLPPEKFWLRLKDIEDDIDAILMDTMVITTLFLDVIPIKSLCIRTQLCRSLTNHSWLRSRIQRGNRPMIQTMPQLNLNQTRPRHPVDLVVSNIFH
ncbi:hypothetical protein V8E53_010997 [Lactarius tabidus]